MFFVHAFDLSLEARGDPELALMRGRERKFARRDCAFGRELIHRAVNLVGGEIFEEVRAWGGREGGGVSRSLSFCE